MTSTKQLAISTTEPFLISLVDGTQLVMEFNRYRSNPSLVGITSYCAANQSVVNECGYEEELERGIPYGDITFNPGNDYLTPFALACMVKVDCGYANEIMETLQRERLARSAFVIQYGNNFGAGRSRAMVWELSQQFEALIGLEPFRGHDE